MSRILRYADHEVVKIGDKAHPIMNTFVKRGNLLHPITHTFVVGKGLDPEAPAILECYNLPPPLSPLAMGRSAFSSNYGIVTESYTFACNNITNEHCRFDGQLPSFSLYPTRGLVFWRTPAALVCLFRRS